MRNLIRKFCLSFAALSSLLSTEITADYYLENYPCADNYSFDDCELCDDFFGRFTFNADLLYWVVRQQGMDYNINTGFSTGTTTFDGVNTFQTINTAINTSRYHFDWRLGYRFGLAYEFTNDGWNFWLNWTHIPGKAHGHRTAEPDLTAHGSWKLTFDSVEGLFRSPYYCTNSCLGWNFVAGLRSARINQKIRAHSQSFSTTPSIIVVVPPTNSLNDAGLAESYNYRGIGPEVGINLNYDLWCGLSLFGKINGSLLYSRARQKTYISNINASGSFGALPSLQVFTNNTSLKSSNYFWQVVSDYAIGISWVQTVDFFEKDSLFTLNLAWEHSQWYSHHETRVGDYDLGFDGITLSGALSF